MKNSDIPGDHATYSVGKPQAQAVCAGCLQPIASPNMTDSINLEQQYRDDYGSDATRGDVQRVLICEKCRDRLDAIREGKTK